MLVRHAYTPTATDTESKPFEDPIETKEPQSLSISSAHIPSPDYTLATSHINEESKPIEASKTRVASPHYTTSPSYSTSPLSPDHPLTQTSPTPTPSRASFYRSTIRIAVRTQPTLPPAISARVTEAMTLSQSSFCKRYRSSYETPSSSASLASSLTLSLRKRYQGTSEPIVDVKTEGDESEAKGTDSESEELKDEGLGSESKEAAFEDQQQQAVLVKDIAEDEPLGLGYGTARRHALKLAKGTVPSTYEIGQSSKSIDQQVSYETSTPRLHVRTTWEDPEDGTVYIDIKCDMPPVYLPVQTLPSPVQIPSLPGWSLEPLSDTPVIPSLVALPVPIATVDEGDFSEIGAQLELHDSVLHDHTKRLDALPRTLFEGYGRDFTELFARLGVVKKEI
nr:hypothetical protein [Tanacetum cinerariifolium]